MVELTKHRFIIIGYDNLNTLGILRSLSEEGLCPYVILLLGSDKRFVVNSKWAKNIIYSQSIEECYTLLVKLFGKDVCKPFVYTTDDSNQSFLDLHYEDLKEKFYFYNAGKVGRVTEFMSKETVSRLAEQCGFNVAKYEVLVPGVLPTKLSYPVITKTLSPCLPGWKKDVYICYTENELLEAYKSMESPALIVQEYVVKKNEMPIHGFSCDGGAQVYLAYYSLYYRMGKDNFGFYNYYRPLEDTKLIEKISKLIKEIGFEGCFEVEFLVDSNDELQFLEVNLRSSMRSYACTYGGVNLPYLWAVSMLKGSIDYKNIYRKKDFFTAMYEPGDYAQYVATKKIPYLQWVKEMFRSDLKFLYNKNDKRPALRYWKQVICDIINYKLFHK